MASKTFDLSVLFRVVDKLSIPMRKMGKTIGGMSTPIKKITKNFQRLAQKAAEAGRKMKDIGQNLALKLTLPLSIMGGIAAKSAISFETAFTGVKKTVEATVPQFAVLKKELMAMALNLPLATEEIFGIAEAAGQLGIKQKDIVQFTKVMADLGATTNLTANEAATSLARFANITGMAQADMERLGSTIVDLGNNTATTEAEIVEMAMRLAGAGNTVGLTAAQIMSLSASLSSVGIRAEAGGTAFSQVMKKIDKEAGTASQKIKDFALVSGKSVAQFEKDWEENAGLAILDFVEGLATLQKEGTNVNIILDDLGMEGIRMSDALLRASGAGDKFRKTMKLGNKAWKENTALTKEAALRYATSAAQLTMAKNRAIQMAVSFGAILVPAILKVIKFLEPIVNWLTELSPVTKTVVIAIGLLTAAIGPLLIGLGLLSAAIAAISVPVTIVVGAVIGLGIAAGLLITYWKPVKQFFTDLFDSINDKIQKVKAAFVNMVPDFLKKKMGLKITTGSEDIAANKQEYFNKLKAKMEETPEGRNNFKKLIQQFNEANLKSETDINIKLTADPGTTATIEKVKKVKGNARTNIMSEAYLGAM